MKMNSTGDKVAIFIGKSTDLNRVASILKGVCRQNKGNFSLTSFDVELPDYFQDLNIRIDYSWDYLSKEDCLDIDNFFFRKLTRSWFLKIPQEYLEENKKNLIGKCTEYSLITFNIVTLIKYIEVIRKVFVNYKPTKLLIVEDAPFLANIVKLFNKIYRFEFLRINPQLYPFLKRLKTFSKKIKVFFVDLVILLMDFFVLRSLFLFKKFENKIIIDYRLYKKFAQTQLKQKLLVCPFEKGLKVRLEMLSKGLFYLPVRVISCFDLFLQGNKLFKNIDNWNKTRARTDIKIIFKYKDIVFWDAVEKYISQIFLINFPRVAANIDTFQKVAQRKNVKLVIMRNDTKEVERSLIEACRPLKIPTLVTQHGITGDINFSDVLGADMTAVWGKAAIDWFRQFGYQDSRFTVTGNPMYDELYHKVSAKHQDITKKKICQKLSLDSSKKIITFCTSSSYAWATSSNQDYEMNIAIRAILNTLKTLADTQLIIKLHPYDVSLDVYKTIIKSLDLNTKVVMVREFNTFDILEASDLVIMKYSSTGLEALILDKPLVDLMLQKVITVKIPYAEEGVAIGVRKIEEIGLAIKDGLYNERIRENLRLNRKKFVLDYAYKIDGQATKRVEELIHKLANNSKKG